MLNSDITYFSWMSKFSECENTLSVRSKKNVCCPGLNLLKANHKPSTMFWMNRQA